MNEFQRIYCDGAAMAYRDTAKKIRDMIAKAPAEVREFMEHLRPLATVCDKKSEEVYREVERIESGTRQ